MIYAPEFERENKALNELLSQVDIVNVIQDATATPQPVIFEAPLIHDDLAFHLKRRDLTLPQVFVNNKRKPSRELMVAFEAKAIFSYLLPPLRRLTPEQILQVRQKVRDTREGFSLHLQKLSMGIEERLNGADSAEEIARWAKSVVETELKPDYREFRRQLVAQTSGFWGKIVDVGAKAFSIDAAPWTPKFYGELMKAFGLTAFTYTSERNDTLSNNSQAFQFMKIVEEEDQCFLQSET